MYKSYTSLLNMAFQFIVSSFGFILKNCKIFTLIIGISIIITTVFSITSGNYESLGFFIGNIFKIIIKILGYGLPHLLKLVFWSFGVLWLPIAIYILISIITTSPWWRFFLCLVTLCGLLLFMQFIIVPNLSLSLSTTFEIFVYLTNIYFVLLWIVPREIWNFIGGAFWFLQSAIVTIMPDLPGNLDDFGMSSAIFAFIFLYLHTLASLIQRFVDLKIVLSISKAINWLFRDKFKKVV